MHDEVEHLKDYLRGMRRGNRKGLAQLTALSDWTDIAQRELERRAAYILQMFPDEVLLGLTSGEIDMRQAIGDVLAE
ncbi:hypothetical protein [Lysobacter antibioticus]|uniref:hypothetical protein n=1 Tax=Lysobacter antibioticus TaxID=84531 RepID=UPI0004D0390A|nr:hypothetical protein [Lysobacter antibioticus]